MDTAPNHTVRSGLAPASLLVQLRPAAGERRSIRGDHLHGWFFDTLGQIDTRAAGALHDGTEKRQRKPFTLWAGRSLPDRGPVVPGDGGNVWLRVTVLEPEVAPLVERVLRHAPTVRLGSNMLSIGSATADAHPWVGITSYDELWETPDAADCAVLHFLSPTAFAADRRTTTLFPLPNLVFEYLVRKWDEHSGRPPVRDSAGRELLESLRVLSHDVHTAGPVSFGTYFLNGFIGRCEYGLAANASPDARHLLLVLTRFAFFCGVGLKTTMGMGQAVGEPGRS